MQCTNKMQRLLDKRTYKALKNKHNIEKPVISNTIRLADAEPSISNKRKMGQQTLSCFGKKETCTEIITKLATVDGISVNVKSNYKE